MPVVTESPPVEFSSSKNLRGLDNPGHNTRAVALDAILFLLRSFRSARSGYDLRYHARVYRLTFVRGDYHRPSDER